MIKREIVGDLWVLTISRPEKANSLTREMLCVLKDYVLAARQADVKALILTGQGRVFSAGADLESAKTGLAVDPIWEALSEGVASAPFLTIAALNGTVAGGAFGMVLACDVRLSVASANFFYPVMELGFLPQPSDPQRMKALIGPAKTKLLLVAGHKANAEEAAHWGLVDHLCDDPLKVAKDRVRVVLSADSSHITAIKSLCA